MKRFGLLFGNAHRRKFRELYECRFDRSMNAAALRALGYRIRTFELKPQPPTYYGA